MNTSVVVPLISQSQLAHRWRLSLSTIERWRCEGKGPVYLKLRGQVRYRLEDVEAFEEKSTRNSTSEAVSS